MAEGSGLVNGLIIGVAGLVIGVLIAFIVVQNMTSVNTDLATKVGSANVVNESLTTVDELGETFTVNDYPGVACTLISVVNSTDGATVVSSNYSATGNGNCGLKATGGQFNNTNWKATFSYTYKPTQGSGDDLVTNFTKGVDNVSSKVPTVLLIAAVVLILGLLAVLWSQYQKMQSGGTVAEL